MSYYVLDDDGRTPIPASFEETVAWRTQNPDAWRVGLTLISPTVQVSTVFLATDQDSYPLLFETLVFGGSLGGHRERYSTWDDAATGHALWVATASADEIQRHAAAVQAIVARINVWQHACPHANIESLRVPAECDRRERCLDCGRVAESFDNPARRRAIREAERERLMRVMDETQSRLRELEGDP